MPTVALTYLTGETIEKGDRIRYAGGNGIVDFVAEPGVADPSTDFYIDEYGGGCMLLTEKFGNVFVQAPDNEESSRVRRARRRTLIPTATRASGARRSTPEHHPPGSESPSPAETD